MGVAYQLTFWGTRGSIPTPGAQTMRYGGNTACISLSAGDGRLTILDAGSGLRPLGTALMSHRGRTLSADILLSHTHWDHIQGLPFFKPLSASGNRFFVYGAAQEGVPLEEILRRQMEPAVFPVPLSALAATLVVTPVVEGTFEVDGFRVEAFRLRHPGTTLGYRLTPTNGGREIAYLTDNELGPGGTYSVRSNWRGALVEFLGGVDTLIHDAMYSESVIAARAGWGHSTPKEAVDLAVEASCRRLVLFHHDPESDDETVDRRLRDARAYAASRAPKLEVEAAAEGRCFTL
ncbi:MAG TPA: MBL fold metallo-hydrolase [Gemmatimonadales bacterium]|nr:MBL fold metallo-hydrolase [Gemmatimonadales bacterium]